MCSKMYGTGECYVKQNKSDTEIQIPHVPSLKWKLNNNKKTQPECRIVVTRVLEGEKECLKRWDLIGACTDISCRTR